jgi:hypothetical protein
MSRACPWAPPQGWWIMIREEGKSHPLALGSPGQEDRPHRSRLPHTDGLDVRFDVLHGVVDGETGGYRTPWGIDVNGDVFFRVLGLQVEQLSHDYRGDVIVDLTVDHNDTVD